MSTKPQRADGRKNREAILHAAARVFARDGFVTAMDRIAAEAGVGRATLYRNFSNLEELALAIFVKNVECFEQLQDDTPPTPEGFETILNALATDIAAHAALGQALALTGAIGELEVLRTRVLDVLDVYRDAAISGGTLRADLSRDDLGLILDTLGQGLPPGDLPDREVRMRRLVSLLMNGLSAQPIRRDLSAPSS